MKQQPTTATAQLVYNDTVKEAYYKLLKYAKQQLSAIDREELRYSLIRKDDIILHELVTPIVYLRLECLSYGLYSIHFGIETYSISNKYSNITASFIRAVYKLTSKDTTRVNIETCVQVDYLITNASELYEHTEEHSQQHTFELIKHKVTTCQRKRLLAVA